MAAIGETGDASNARPVKPPEPRKTPLTRPRSFRDECSQRHCPHRRTSGPGTDLKTTEPPQHSPPAPVSRSQIIGLMAGHLKDASGAAARPGSARSLDPPGHEPQTWQLSGKQETPVTHAQSSRQNPAKPP